MSKRAPGSMRTRQSLCDLVEDRLSSPDGRAELVRIATWPIVSTLPLGSCCASRRASPGSWKHDTVWPTARSANVMSRQTGLKAEFSTPVPGAQDFDVSGCPSGGRFRGWGPGCTGKARPMQNGAATNCRAAAQLNVSARLTSSSRPGSPSFHGFPGWMMQTWQISAASTSWRKLPASRSAM